jgi:hypothetical protein
MGSASTGEAMDVLAIHSGALGDVVLFARMLHRLGGATTLVAGRGKAELAVGLGLVDRAIDFDALAIHEVFAEPDGRGRLGDQLPPCRRVVSCFATGDPRGERRLMEAVRAARGDFLPVRPGEQAGHLLDVWARRLGLESMPLDRWPSMRAPDAWRHRALEALERAGVGAAGPLLVVHPGSGGERKCWAIDRYVQLVGRLLAGGAFARAVVTLGPVELDRWGPQIGEALADRLPDGAGVLAGPTLRELAGLLAIAEAYVGNDSGVSHLAAAVGTRAVVLFGPTRAEQFRPPGARVAVVAARALEEIDVADVVGALG